MVGDPGKTTGGHGRAHTVGHLDRPAGGDPALWCTGELTVELMPRRLSVSTRPDPLVAAVSCRVPNVIAPESTRPTGASCVLVDYLYLGSPAPRPSARPTPRLCGGGTSSAMHGPVEHPAGAARISSRRAPSTSLSDQVPADRHTPGLAVRAAPRPLSGAGGARARVPQPGIALGFPCGRASPPLQGVTLHLPARSRAFLYTGRVQQFCLREPTTAATTAANGGSPPQPRR